MKWNLRNRILVPTLGLLAVTIIISGLVSFLMSRSALTQTLDAQLQQLCDAGVRQIENWVGGQRQNLVLWSVRPDVLAAVQAKADSGSASGAVSAQLAQAKQTYGFYEDLHLADLKGDTLASSNPESVGKLNVADREYFKKAAATGQTVISEVLKSRTTGNPIVVIAVPVKDGQSVKAVFYGVLDLDSFNSKFVSTIKILQSGYAFLYDEKSICIAHPDKKQILQTKIADFDWGKKMLQMRNGELKYSFNGVARTGAFRTSDVLGWGFATTVPNAELNAAGYRMGKVNLLLAVGALVAGLLLMLATSRAITRPIQNVAKQLSLGSDQTTAAAGQLSATSQSLAEGASEQAASLEETRSSIEEMATMTENNANGATKASELTKEARTAADAGAADMQAMETAMRQIKASSDDIGKIIKTIDEIAFQTNILALNAAVEAARAGEAGMGFAVVADEVRNLAQRCAQSAKETALQIEQAIDHSNKGVEISTKVTAGLQQILAKIRDVDEISSHAAAASREQSQQIAQINLAIGQVDKVTQSNAASAEESASAAEELSAQAEMMRGSITDLLRLVDGIGDTTVASRSVTPAFHLDKSKSIPNSGRTLTSGSKRETPAIAAGKGGTLDMPKPHRKNAPAIPMAGDFAEF